MVVKGFLEHRELSLGEGENSREKKEEAFQESLSKAFFNILETLKDIQAAVSTFKSEDKNR